MHCVLIVLLWRVSYFRSILLGLSGVTCLWLAMLVGFMLGKGRFEEFDLLAALVFWLLSSGCCLLWFGFPRGRVPQSRRAPLREYFSFNLRGLFVFVTLLAILLGIASLPRGERWHFWNCVYSTRHGEAYYENSLPEFQAWLSENGYVPAGYPGAANHVGLAQDEAAWYAKELPGGEKVYVLVVTGGVQFRISIQAQMPDRLLPYHYPQETEAERAQAELRRVWEEYEVAADGR